LTAPESTSAIVSFAREGAEATLRQKLSDAGISVSLYQNRIRISPSLYNTMDDIEHLLKVLS
jgi:selenocysteine lyase/cysteine desulfurase